MEKEENSTFPKETYPNADGSYDGPTPYELPNKSFVARLWPVFACGAGLFSDGYLQSV